MSAARLPYSADDALREAMTAPRRPGVDFDEGKDMSDDATNLVLEHLRHIRASQDRTEQRLDDLTTRVGRIETNIAQIYVTLAEHSVRFDHLETRITRIEKRLDLTEA